MPHECALKHIIISWRMSASETTSGFPPNKKMGQKRKRDQSCKSQQIPGIPPSLSPVLLEAIKVRRRYLSKVAESSVTLRVSEEGVASQPPSDNSKVSSSGAERADDLIGKLAARSDKVALSRSGGETQEHVRLRGRAADATKMFLNAVRRDATTRGANNFRENQKASGGPHSVPVRCLVFLLDLFYADNEPVKMATRRSALGLAFELLRRSASSRAAFCSADWLKRYVSHATKLSSTSNCRAGSEAVPLEVTVQREAVLLLSELSDKFGSLYPRLMVAHRYLEENQGILCQKDISNEVSSARRKDIDGLRKVRDLAIKWGEKECSRVRKIIRRADKCFEVLVPRLGTAPSQKMCTPQDVKNVISKGNWSDDEDSGIDWEDVYDCDNGDEKDYGTGASIDNHEAAVERTLEVMEKSQGLEEGALEIDFDKRDDNGEENGQTLHNLESDSSVLQILHLCANTILTEHKPRIDEWVHSLIAADGMTSQRQEGSYGSSLVVLDVTLRRKRNETLKMLMGYKRDISRMLTAAGKLGITAGESSSPMTTRQMKDIGAITDHIRKNDSRPGYIEDPLVMGLPTNDWRVALGISLRSRKKTSAKDRIMAEKRKYSRRSRGSKLRLQIKLRNDKK